MGRLLALLLRVLVVGVPHVGLGTVVADEALGIRACDVSQVLLVLFHLVLHQLGQGGPEVCDESVESHCLLLIPLVPAHLWEEAVALDRFVADLWAALPALVKNEMEEDEKYLGYVARTYAKRYIRHNGAKPYMWNPNHKNAEKESE